MIWVALGGAFGLIGVAFGTFGAHGLRGSLDPDALGTFETGVRYQMYHALALLFLGAMGGRLGLDQSNWIGWLFTAGIVIFSGSLYLLAITGWRWFGAITPLGGLCFLAGWAVLGWRAFSTG